MAKPRINDFFIKDYGVWDSIGEWVDRREMVNGNLKLASFYYWVEDKGRIVWCQFKGHDYQPDQCGIPEHDYCPWCLSARPDNIPRPI
jgi:hypothetical protein